MERTRRLSSAQTLLMLVVPLLLEVACTQPDSLYCDDTTPCSDPSRPFCDVSGNFPASSGVAKTCIADPNAIADAGRPDGEIKECSESSQCSVMTPICSGELCSLCVPAGSGDSDCAAKDPTKPNCGDDGRCYECTDSADCQSLDTQVCDIETKTCVGCDDHSQCSSGACDMESGSCEAEADVIHVNAALGSDGPLCGAGPDAAACQHLDRQQGAFAKVQGTRQIIVMAPGNYIGVKVLSVPSLKATIYGNGAQIFLANFVEGPAIEILGPSDLVLHDLVLRNGNGGSKGSGVSCIDSTIEFHNVTIQDNEATGVTSNRCKLLFWDSVVQDNARVGLRLQNSELLFLRSSIHSSGLLGVFARESSVQIEQSTLRGNAAGGVKLEDTEFTIENSVISKNGNKIFNPSNFAGGVLIRNNRNISPQVIRHCTIVENDSPTNISAAGIDCGFGDPVDVTSNIIVGNEKPTGLSQVGGSCNTTFSNVTGIVSGQGNISLEPSFVNPMSGDYHLAAGSAGIDLANPNSPTMVDVDNEERPSGDGFDMGADERQ